MSLPPPQSPEIGPTAGNRVIRPSGATPEQLMPNPQTTPTPQSRSVPARSTANVSLRTSRSSRDPPGPQPAIDPAVVDREVGAGQAVDAELGDRYPSGARVQHRRRLPPRRRGPGPCGRRRRSDRSRWWERGRRRARLRPCAAGPRRSSSHRRRRRGWRAVGSRERLQVGDGDEGSAVRPKSVDRRADRVGRPSGPRVEQDDGTVAVSAHPVDRVTRDRLAGSRWLPSPRAPRSSGRCGSRGPRGHRAPAASSWPAPNGHRNQGRGSTPVAARIAR